MASGFSRTKRRGIDPELMCLLCNTSSLAALLLAQHLDGTTQLLDAFDGREREQVIEHARGLLLGRGTICDKEPGGEQVTPQGIFRRALALPFLPQRLNAAIEC